MPHFKCLACKRPLRSNKSEADPIGDLSPVCGSLLEPVGDLGEIVGYRVIETRGGQWHSGASGAGRLIAGASARSSLDASWGTPESGPKLKAATLTLSAEMVKPLALALPARATTPREAPPPRSCRAAARPSSFRRRRHHR